MEADEIYSSIEMSGINPSVDEPETKVACVQIIEATKLRPKYVHYLQRQPHVWAPKDPFEPSTLGASQVSLPTVSVELKDSTLW